MFGITKHIIPLIINVIKAEHFTKLQINVVTTQQIMHDIIYFPTLFKYLAISITFSAFKYFGYIVVLNSYFTLLLIISSTDFFILDKDY